MVNTNQSIDQDIIRLKKSFAEHVSTSFQNEPFFIPNATSFVVEAFKKDLGDTQMQIEIVMYHYVRPIDADRFPHLNVLTLVEFERQLEFFKRHKSFVDFEQIKDAANNGKPLPKNSIWLTFDDGYADHINYVAPILEKNDVRAAFFPVIESSFNKKLLDVNAIQHIIASSKSDKFLIKVLKSEMSKLGLGEQDFDFFWTSVEKISRYDRPEIKFFKNLLQKTLPSELRSVLIDRIFEEVVNISKDELSKTLYIWTSMILDICIKRAHDWLSLLQSSLVKLFGEIRARE